MPCLYLSPLNIFNILSQYPSSPQSSLNRTEQNHIVVFSSLNSIREGLFHNKSFQQHENLLVIRWIWGSGSRSPSLLPSLDLGDEA
mmetsp:Transcript_39017/g.81653  ORF Transcript_39017/g.81653 Transcript_39017/m.81653 type:complete len:86 (+) Transcript_39017:611-868(+)